MITIKELENGLVDMYSLLRKETMESEVQSILLKKKSAVKNSIPYINITKDWKVHKKNIIY